MLFLGNRQYGQLADIAIEAADTENPTKTIKGDKKRIKQIVSNDRSIDVALFGRMVADDTNLNVDACAQVAHAISVQTVEPESDFFTAVDDNQRNGGEDEAGDAGAAMMGQIESELSGEPGKRGKRTGIIRAEEQQEWLFHQARRAGFHMPINRLELPEVLVRHSVREKFRRKGSTVTLTSATYDGVLVVDDPDLLRRSLIEGIGRAKGYGFGLLTLVPLADDHRKEPRS